MFCLNFGVFQYLETALQNGQEDGEGDSLRVEASLLVLRNPAAAPPDGAAARASLAGGAPAGAGSAAAPPPPPPPRAQRLPASSWNAMSALAGVQTQNPVSTLCLEECCDV